MQMKRMNRGQVPFMNNARTDPFVIIDAFALRGDVKHDERITQGAAALCPGLCAFAPLGRTNLRLARVAILRHKIAGIAREHDVIYLTLST